MLLDDLISALRSRADAGGGAVPAGLLKEAADNLQDKKQLQAALQQAQEEAEFKPSVARKLNEKIRLLEGEIETLRSDKQVKELERKIRFLEGELKESYKTKNFALKAQLLELAKKFRSQIESDDNVAALWADVEVMLDMQSDGPSIRLLGGGMAPKPLSKIAGTGKVSPRERISDTNGGGLVNVRSRRASAASEGSTAPSDSGSAPARVHDTVDKLESMMSNESGSVPLPSAAQATAAAAVAASAAAVAGRDATKTDVSTQAALAPETSETGLQTEALQMQGSEVALQADLRPERSEAALQTYDARLQTSDAAMQASASTAEAGQQAELRPPTAEVGEQAGRTPETADAGHQVLIAAATADAGQQAEVRAPTADAGAQAGWVPKTAEAGHQVALAAATADAGHQVAITVESTEAGLQTQAATAESGVQAGSRPPDTAEAGHQAELRAETSERGLQASADMADASVQPDRAATADAGHQAAVPAETADSGAQAGSALPETAEASQQAQAETADSGTQAERAATAEAGQQADLQPFHAAAHADSPARSAAADSPAAAAESSSSTQATTPDAADAHTQHEPAAVGAGDARAPQAAHLAAPAEQPPERLVSAALAEAAAAAGVAAAFEGSGVMYKESGSELAAGKVDIGQTLDLIDRLSRRNTEASAAMTAEAMAAGVAADAGPPSAAPAAPLSPSKKEAPLAVVAQQMAVLAQLKEGGTLLHAAQEADVTPEQLTDLNAVAKELNTLKASNLHMAAQLQVHESLVQHLNLSMKAAVEQADDAEHSLWLVRQQLEQVKNHHRLAQEECAELTKQVINNRVQLGEATRQLLQLRRRVHFAVAAESSLDQKLADIRAILAALPPDDVDRDDDDAVPFFQRPTGSNSGATAERPPASSILRRVSQNMFRGGGAAGGRTAGAPHQAVPEPAAERMGHRSARSSDSGSAVELAQRDSVLM